jgi:hypothetical protein
MTSEAVYHGQRVRYRIHSPSINRAGFGHFIGQRVRALQAYILFFEMLPILPFSHHPPSPILNRPRDVRCLDVLATRNIRNRALQFENAVDGGPLPLTAFLYRCLGQADDGDGGQFAPDVHFDVSERGV